VSFTHYPPSDEFGAERLRVATVAWAPLLGALHAVGFRPYLELERGGREDSLRLYCELDDDLLLDLSIEDAGIPETPEAACEGDWAVFVQDADGDYLSEVVIDPTIDYTALADRLKQLVEAVAAGERPMFEDW
jgi:hypothetical protein